MNILILFLILIIYTLYINCEEMEYNYYQNMDYNKDYRNQNYMNIASITYELTYNNFSIVKVTIKTYSDFINDINFKAFLKSEEEEKEYLLKCSTSFYDTIECFSEKNISLNTKDKFYFYYKKEKNGQIIFDERDILEDYKRISLIFKPEIKKQKLYKDKRKIIVDTNNEIIGGGYLYIVKKSKNILQKPKDGFNKYIDLNNFISNAGISEYSTKSTSDAFKESIKRGFHILKADILFSKDKIPVICHEQDLSLVSNEKGKISSKTLKQLEKIEFGNKGEKILTFENLLKLCKENNVIIDLNLENLELKKYFLDTEEYLQIMLDLIEKYDMFNSIYFNDAREESLLKLKSIKNGLSFSISVMNETQNMENIKDKFNDSKRIIYNMDGLSNGKSINEMSINHGLLLGTKIKASQVDDIKFAEKIQSWGVNYITTNKLHPFMIKNNKEDPIIVRCSPSIENEYISECLIDNEVKLIDNEIYNIYYSNNIYNISEDINEEPIGEFEYVDTNILNELYYSIIDFNYNQKKIKLKTSNKIKKGKYIKGIIGPAYDNVAECFQYNFICDGNNSYFVNCIITKDDNSKIEVNSNYTIYSVEGYSMNPEEIDRRLYFKKRLRDFLFIILVVVILIIIKNIVIYIKEKRKEDNLKQMKISDNSYISDNSLYR